MADLSDVQDVIVATIAGILYPNGTGQPSVAVAPVLIFAGWPIAQNLDQDLAAGRVNISIYPRESRKVTKYPSNWQVLAVSPATFSLTVDGTAVTVGGAAPDQYAQQNMTVLLGGQAFVYPTQPGDSPTSIATALASLIAQVFPGTTNSGPTITVPPGPLPSGRVGTLGTTVREVGRWQQAFQVTIWTSSPITRKAVSVALLPPMMDTPWLAMLDGLAARMTFDKQTESDNSEKSQLYRRDLFVTVEYGETMAQQTATVEVVTTAQFNFDTGEQLSVANF